MLFTTVRKTQMAFVDSSVKPPRTVRRAQIRNGTAGNLFYIMLRCTHYSVFKYYAGSMDHVDKLERLSSHGG